MDEPIRFIAAYLSMDTVKANQIPTVGGMPTL
jgi:hypothetical protein